MKALILGTLSLLCTLVLVLPLTGCAANQASQRDSLPVENVQQCGSLCQSVGLQLTSVVVVANQTGCVCSPVATAQGGSVGSTAAATGGAVAVLLSRERERRQQR